MEKKDVRVKSHMELQRAAAYLQELVDSLKAGKIVVEHAADAIELAVPEHVTVQVKARSKVDKESISFKISWRNEEALAEGVDDLRISSTSGSPSASS